MPRRADAGADHRARSRPAGCAAAAGPASPPAIKWAKVRAAAGDEKYIICNGDEGDPGAFMDRMLLESYPYRVIEGMAIAARAVGAHEGFFYIRAEYPLAVERINEALRALRRSGGCWAIGAGQRLPARTWRSRKGPGRSSAARRRPCWPRSRAAAACRGCARPIPAESGLWGKPTLVNNVETYALVPWIIRHGAEAFAALGTEKSKGTKVFALAGKVRRGGLIEVPMGITIRQIVEEIGGGVAEGRHVQGRAGRRALRRLRPRRAGRHARRLRGPHRGPGRSWAPAGWSCWTTPTAWSTSPATSSASPRTSRAASVPSAASARGGCWTSSTASAPARASRATWTSWSNWPRTVKRGSLCGLGKTAPNPVLSTLRYFRDEYEAHLAGRCPAGRCKALIRYRDHRRVHRLHALRPALPGRRHPHDALRAARDRPGEVHPLRHLPAGVPGGRGGSGMMKDDGR